MSQNIQSGLAAPNLALVSSLELVLVLGTQLKSGLALITPFESHLSLSGFESGKKQKKIYFHDIFHYFQNLFTCLLNDYDYLLWLQINNSLTTPL